ncbi:glycine betaine/L-proline ABC transporter substrate-binding protein ProX [Roseibium album]|uniref:Glycine betaine-binding periplasmic protein n=1 Tax=Roseibium album TaxID=311410 RepID=A0A0M6Z3P9_9HYPH|nr:glycine betaine/L-proline ABC transporter substrate-binding protein ProX [Roseibium album]MBG6204509.1 glycine betaine/proline transport system substrate-binding protein [Labrenzia sp. EL_13]CTQ57425.1 Glycine betaine-binding periplasmic protein precursor [Roseibium album]CTQ69511.1 Glycine betaine-binding periplasmic protein precursor [Roseibium album]CTQ71573.1 Glycine betaine-binding periplasmic protein precursor [Roseibium album]
MRQLSLVALAAVMASAAPVVAQELPGNGVSVSPIKGSPANAWFQHMVVQLGLEALGYDVQETLEADFPAVHLAVASGDADYTFNHWKPLHNGFFDKSGGEAVMTRVNASITGAGQGYFIDKKTAEEHGIKDIGQLQDPAVSAIFDSDGDGRANLSGCNPGWGCELAIEKHLDDYDLRETVQHDQGSYFAIMADTITRYNEGGSILYYTWTPNWISDVLVPGNDVVQVGVPTDGEFDAGFAVNDVYIVANNDFLEENQAAARFFKLVKIPIAAVNAAQVKLRDGENTLEDFRRHAEDWVEENQAEFDGWVTEAAKAN